MYSSLSAMVRDEQVKDYLREAEIDRLALKARAGRPGLYESGRQAVGSLGRWLGARLAARPGKMERQTAPEPCPAC